jgi:prepilin-type N-terminal cleavage/methylation domain-containing protein
MRKSSILHPPSSILRGFTIIECLIGLAISAILLAAVAVAFNASVTNYRENEDMFWSVNNARQALARMTSEIRIGYPIQLTEPNNQCSFITASNEDITYEFRSADHKVYLRKNTVPPQEYVLCVNPDIFVIAGPVVPKVAVPIPTVQTELIFGLK